MAGKEAGGDARGRSCPGSVGGVKTPGGAGRGAPTGRAGAGLQPRVGWGRGCRTHAAAAPGCLEPWDMAAPGPTWKADAWPSEGRPSRRRGGPAGELRNAGPGVFGGAGSRGGEALEGGRPGDPLLGDRPPEGPAHSPPVREGPLPGPRPPPCPHPLAGPRVPRLFSPPKKLSRTSLLLRRSNQPPRARPCLSPRPRHANTASASVRIGCNLSLGRDHADEGWRAGRRLAGATAGPRGRWIGKGAGGCVKFGCARPLSGPIRAL